MRSKRILAVIPARFNSTRLPAKALADINGSPLIRWVWNGSKQSKFISRLIVATDDTRIEEACHNFGAEVIMTPEDLPSGSDRVLYTYHALDEKYDYVLNIQGDEPMINGGLIDGLIKGTIKADSDAGTIIHKIEMYDDLFNNSIVKVVLNKNSEAVYFSRSPVPYLRDVPATKWLENADYWKHIGIYLYKSDSLFRFGQLPQSKLEKIEKLEQLRLLEDGAVFYCYKSEIDMIGIDTPNDLEKIRTVLSSKLP